MTFRGFVRKVLISLEIEDTRKFRPADILGYQNSRRPAKYKQQPKAALSVAAVIPLQNPRGPSFEQMYLQEVLMFAKTLLCRYCDLSSRGGIMRAILIFSKGWSKRVVVTPLIIPKTPFSLIILYYLIQQQSNFQSINKCQNIRGGFKFNYQLIIIFIMKGSRGSKFFKYFLKSSPRALYKKQRNVLFPLQSKKQSPLVMSDQDYVEQFLDRTEIFRYSPRMKPNTQIHNIFPDIFKNYSIEREEKKSAPIKQSDRLLTVISRIAGSGKETLILYQEMVQQLAIASPEDINEVKKRLIYLFKVLLNRRDKLQPNSLQLEVNVQLSHAIIQSFYRALQICQLQSDLKRLQAMEKLTQAKANQKKGLKEIAMNDFQEICRDSAASAKTRFEALKVLCMDSEEIGNTKILEQLLIEMKERGQKQYEQYLSESIERIRVGQNNGQNKKVQ